MPASITKPRSIVIDSEEIERTAPAYLEDLDAILVPGGFGRRGTEGKIAAIRYARENKGAVSRHLPRHATGVVEFARCCGLAGAQQDRVRCQDTPYR